MKLPKRVHVIACGVLAIDMKAAADRVGVAVSADYLEGGLHDKPTELRRRLQQAIDQVSDPTQVDLIVVGYGICGRGTVGISARGVPLAIPKAHDCIALFLGSDRAYQEEFARFPGTYYISAGWFKEKVQPRAKRLAKGAKAKAGGPGADPDALTEKYGPENAQAITDFLNSWQRNYQRAAFIDTGTAAKKKYASYAQAMAEEFNWRYEELKGNLSLLEKTITAQKTTDEVLLVPPHHTTAYDAVAGGLKAVPIWKGKTPRRGRAKADADFQPPAPAHDRETRIRYGLGIDAGGTYTDAVLFDFTDEKIVAKGKALTTKWDFTIGIEGALSFLDAELLRKVQLAAVSTTLATNAIVEGHGQEVGLLVMPPYGLFEPEDIPHEPKAVIAGRLDISGKELSSIDPAEVARAADDMIARHKVGAFAVSGFASTINPEHELQVKAALRAHTGLSVTCGHELSELLDFRVRAQTAVLNGRIIPRLERFIRQVEQCLTARGVTAPVMVVKGDGSLMSARAAKDRPVETILSGPAASVAGAKYLTNLPAAIVVDMGGTTTDTAVLTAGGVGTCAGGATVGGLKTHVRALDMRTVGLGGDSLIAYESQRLRIGPLRVAPVAYLSWKLPATAAALEYIERHIDDFGGSTAPMEILASTGYSDGSALDAEEQEVLTALAERPLSMAELAVKTGREHWCFLHVRGLEERHLIQRCGLTPTDLLHVRGQFQRWDSAAAGRLCEVFCQMTHQGKDEFIAGVVDRIVRRLATELLKKRLDGRVAADAMDGCPACQGLLDNLLSGGGPDFDVRVHVKCPVVGIGAPVHYFLPKAAALLNTEAVVPAHADVANAVGAITSSVVVSHSALVCPNQTGGYTIEGLPSAGQFSKFQDACAHAEESLRQFVAAQARAAGAGSADVRVDTKDRLSTASDGTEIFLGRTLTASLTARPVLS